MCCASSLYRNSIQVALSIMLYLRARESEQATVRENIRIIPIKFIHARASEYVKDNYLGVVSQILENVIAPWIFFTSCKADRML